MNIFRPSAIKDLLLMSRNNNTMLPHVNKEDLVDCLDLSDIAHKFCSLMKGVPFLETKLNTHIFFMHGSFLKIKKLAPPNPKIVPTPLYVIVKLQCTTLVCINY